MQTIREGGDGGMKWYRVQWTHREDGRELTTVLCTRAGSVAEAKKHATRGWKARYAGAEKTPRMCNLTIREEEDE